MKEVWILVVLVRADNDWGEPHVYAFDSFKAANAAMVEDYKATWGDYFNHGKGVFDTSETPFASDNEAWIIGTDDTVWRWYVKEAKIESSVG